MGENPTCIAGKQKAGDIRTNETPDVRTQVQAAIAQTRIRDAHGTQSDARLLHHWSIAWTGNLRVPLYSEYSLAGFFVKRFDDSIRHGAGN